MKDILVCTNSFPPHYGGIAVYGLEIATNLCRMPGVRVRLLAPFAQGCREVDAKLPFPVVRFKGKASLYLKFMRLAARADVIFVAQRGNFATLSYWAAFFARVPYVVVVHGVEPARKHARIARNLNAASAVVAVSNFIADFLASIGVERGVIRVINNGAAVYEAGGEDIRRKHGLEGKTLLLTVGRLIPRKGHDNVIAALPGILERVPNAHYLVIGDGVNRGRLEGMVRELGLEKSVTFAGNVPHERLGPYYHGCDLFVMMSRDIRDSVESFGIVYLEAGGAGKAVVGGRGGGTADAVIDGQTGLLVDPEDIDGIAAAVTRLLLDPAERARLGGNGKRRVQEEFSWGAVAKRYADLLTGVAG